MKARLSVLFAVLLASVGQAATNVAPTAVVISVAQRAGTTYMDIDYRVDDPDDATVQTAALGFVNGGTDLSTVLKINTLVEGTAANIGSNTPANTQKRLTWNMAADWNTNLGNVQVEILAKDGRGLLPFHWITLPTNGVNPEITINDRPIYDTDLLPLWYWLIATGDPAVQFVNGQVLAVGGNYNANLLAQGTSTTAIGWEFIRQRFNIRTLTSREQSRARAGRYGFQAVDNYSVAKGFVMQDLVYGWGRDDFGQASFTNWSSNPVHLPKVTAVSLGSYSTFVLADGEIYSIGVDWFPVPADATNVVAISAGGVHVLALRSNGTVLGWGNNTYGQVTIPSSATNVVAVGAVGWSSSAALRSDGTIVTWGDNSYGQIAIPASATNLVAIAAGGIGGWGLKADGTIVGWGCDSGTEASLPSNVTNVIALAAGSQHCLALRRDGTVLGWGDNSCGQISIPASVTNVVAIAAGQSYSLALKADGIVVVWGDNSYGQLNVPVGLSGIGLIGGGNTACHVVVVRKGTP